MCVCLTANVADLAFNPVEGRFTTKGIGEFNMITIIIKTLSYFKMKGNL